MTWINTLTVPTVGRKVWFWPHPDVNCDDVVVLDSSQPLDATVVFVNHETQRVNLLVVDHQGGVHDAWDVPLFDPLPPNEIKDEVRHIVDMNSDDNCWGIASWMPYQAAQHAKDAGKTPVSIAAAPHTLVGGQANLVLTDGKDV